MQPPERPSLDQLRASLLIAQAQYEKYTSDADAAVGKFMWLQASTIAGKAFEYQQKADTIRAARSPNDEIAKLEAQVYEMGADTFVAAYQDLARVIEKLPSLRDPVVIKQINGAWKALSQNSGA